MAFGPPHASCGGVSSSFLRDRLRELREAGLRAARSLGLDLGDVSAGLAARREEQASTTSPAAAMPVDDRHSDPARPRHEPREPTDTSRAAFVNDVVAVLKDADCPLPVTMVGQSMGTHTALLVAPQRPDPVGRLIMIEGELGGGGATAGNCTRRWRHGRNASTPTNTFSTPSAPIPNAAASGPSLRTSSGRLAAPIRPTSHGSRGDHDLSTRSLTHALLKLTSRRRGHALRSRPGTPHALVCPAV